MSTPPPGWKPPRRSTSEPPPEEPAEPVEAPAPAEPVEAAKPPAPAAPPAPAEPPAPTAPGVRLDLSRSFLWAMGGALGIVVGSIGTWASVGPFSVGGTSSGGDGTFTLLMGIVAAVLIVLERYRGLVAALAGAALSVGLIDARAIASSGNDLFEVSLGWGLVLLCLSAAALLVWAVRELLGPAGGERRQLLLVGVIVAIVGTSAVMALSGRLDTDDADSGSGSSLFDDDEEPDGPPQTGAVGEAVTLKGEDGVQVRLRVTGVTDPLPADDFGGPEEGARNVGVELELTNTGTATYNGYPTAGSQLITTADRQIDTTFVTDGACKDLSDVTMAPGATRRACVPFEIADADTPATFELSLDGESAGTAQIALGP